MGLNPKAPAWTPGPSSSGDRRGDSLGRIRRAVHGVGTHKSVGGAETLGVGGLNLPMKKGKRRANLYSQRVQQAIRVLRGDGLVGGNPTMNTPRLLRGGGIASSSFFLFYLYWYSYIVYFVVTQLPSLERWALLPFWSFPALTCFFFF